MAITFDAKETVRAKAFIKAILKYAGVTVKNPPTVTYKYYGRAYNVDWYVKSQAKVEEKAKLIYDEIVNRGCTFLSKNLDEAITYFSSDSPDGIAVEPYEAGFSKVTRAPQAIALYIAWFCEQQELYWDDSDLTTYEFEAIKGTILGGVLAKANLFVSQVPETPVAKTRAASTKTPGAAPANGYKGTGAHSQDIPNLIGDANKKVYLSSPPIFAIEADKTGKNVPNAYITPLKTTNTGIITVSKANAEKINFGSGNGYTDCKLWFANYAEADKVREYCESLYGSKFENIRVVKYNYTDKNGFFQVTTSAGVNAYIKAVKLNEELDAIMEDYIADGKVITDDEANEIIKQNVLTDVADDSAEAIETDTTSTDEIAEVPTDEEPVEEALTEAPKTGVDKSSVFAAIKQARLAKDSIDLEAFEEGMTLGRA